MIYLIRPEYNHKIPPEIHQEGFSICITKSKANYFFSVSCTIVVGTISSLKV